MASTRAKPKKMTIAAKTRRKPTDAVLAERGSVFAMLRPIVEVIGNIVGDNVEVVLHDLTQPEHSVVKIVNGQVSGRSVGDSILSGPGNDKGFLKQHDVLPTDRSAPHSIISDYQTITKDGFALRSSTVIFRDSQGTPFASICINVDISAITQAHGLLESMLCRRNEPEPVRDGSQSVEVLMNDIISESMRKFGKRNSPMNKEAKINAVEAMMERGLFTIKGGVERAAEALGITRFTIYNYLEILRRRHPDTV